MENCGGAAVGFPPIWTAAETHTDWLGNEITAMPVGAVAFAIFVGWFYRMVRGSNGWS